MRESLQMGVPFRWDHGDEAYETEHCMCRPSAVPIRSASEKDKRATDRAISVARRSGGPRRPRAGVAGRDVSIVRQSVVVAHIGMSMPRSVWLMRFESPAR